MTRRKSWKKKTQDVTSIPGLDPISGIKDHLKFLQGLKKDLKHTKQIRRGRLHK